MGKLQQAMGKLFDGKGICKSRAYLKRDSELLTGGAGPRGPVLGCPDLVGSRRPPGARALHGPRPAEAGGD
jgi:hypothetical protein